MKMISQNKKARHDYIVLEKFEAGIALTGTEVKSCRAGGVSLVDAYASIQDGNLQLTGVHIAPYEQGNRNNHEPRRLRRLLMHKREITRLKKSVEAKGLTLVPLSFYFNDKGKVKVELGLCRGKNVRDKRDDLKKREADRDIRRALTAKR
ncbi:MAG TPA: SsrA-binding protein SmpB [Lentisphaeria bacterium]|nr:SsrA-binding protein SmpB [Lentisphaerota bacterium]OQC15434.1 MAG: SsrA-binding protein [Lentisphaerae bacterium ADurb.Bin082]HQC53276.1 SsrA-binding protein SmpB [Lentisphaeria bacterium]HQL86741.1 SsrA-binding protein SmpB [Lentisphaeria bacterium]